ncbi:MAG: hypothetical protein JRH01_22500 [Deltaproteobacteria bacterium]|nr:hypothetical protein [Deltaproteobacteria bacterium]
MHDALYFELGYTRAVVEGGWKYIALRYPEWAHTMSFDERKRRLDEFNGKRRALGRRALTDDPLRPFSHVSLVPGGLAAGRVESQYPAYHDSDQLYDLEADPGEQRNLAESADKETILVRMRALLREAPFPEPLLRMDD